jgi:hypothetical protein
VWRLETGDADHLDLRVISATFAALGAAIEVSVRPPVLPEERRLRDPAHALLNAYAARRLARQGWLTRTEVEVRSGRAIGWIDVLAFRPVDAACVAVECKTQLPDLGGVQRQVNWYVREAISAARSIGWRARSASGLLLLLDTRANAEVLVANSGLFRGAFPARAPDLRTWLASPGDRPLRPGLAAVDPLSRRWAWLKATVVDGRRTAASYADYSDFMRQVEAHRRRSG